METHHQQQPKKIGKWAKNSITARMLMVGILTIVLLIPLSFIKRLIHEREINQKWGKEVLLYGPMLKIPYKVSHIKEVYNELTKKSKKESYVSTEYAYFFPNKLDIKSTINPQEKQRGIYKTAVYKSAIDVTGNFTKPDFSDRDINDKDILWDKAKLIIETSNLKGVNSLVEIHLNTNKYSFESKYEQKNTSNYNQLDLHKLESKSIKKEDLPIENEVNFTLNININGSKQIRFIPVGTFGVNFMIPVDEYQKSERSAKYGFLVIGLTFLIFFLIQTMSKINIHPFQYLMIGIALTMFYTLLISISEHSSYLKAYLIAGIAVIVLITLYSKSILKNIKFPLFIGASLTILYTFIFVIIQLENYALLVGSIGLFAILAGYWLLVTGYWLLVTGY